MSNDDMDFEIDPAAAEAAQKASAAASEQLDIIVPSTAPDATLEQSQLAEFNGWVRRYNTYQHQLESYWRERLAAEGITGGKGSATKSRKGNVNKDKWFRRYEELVSVHNMICLGPRWRGRNWCAFPPLTFLQKMIDLTYILLTPPTYTCNFSSTQLEFKEEHGHTN